MNQKELPPLVEQSSTFKLIVPENVEAKIRYLLRKYPSTEWSGVLFYDYRGTFENNDLILTCRDLYPMDLGNATFTEFKMNEDVASYIAQNIELFDCELGLIHSHHAMSTFFSGTDIHTLRDEGNDRNCFVSLIVNNAGEYSAAITRKMQTDTEIKILKVEKSYEFFGKGPVTEGETSQDIVKSFKKETIEYFKLDIERTVVDNPFDYLDRRFAEIEKGKKEQAFKKYSWGDEPFYGSTPRQLTLWDKYEEEEGGEKPIITIPAKANPGVDKAAVHQAVCRMVTCSLILNVEKFDLKQWVTRHLDNKYKELFGEDSQGEFLVWIDFIVNYTVSHLTDACLAKAGRDIEDEDMLMSEIAEAMQKELKPYIGNEYIKVYYDTLQDYIFI